MNSETLVRILQQASQSYLTDEDYFTYFMDARKQAEDEMRDRGGVSMSFTIIGVPTRDNLKPEITLIIITDWPPPIGKEVFMKALGKKYVVDNPDRMPMMLIHTAEAWVSRLPKDSKVEMAPSNDPQRKEAVVISAMSMDMRKSQVTMFIKRDDKEDFAGWSDVSEVLYKPGESNDLVNYLSSNFYMGYFEQKGHGRGSRDAQ